MTPDPEEQDDATDAMDEGADEAQSIVEDPDTIRTKAAERDQFLAQLKRSMADFQNYKGRVEREKGDLRKFVRADVIRAMLPILDNLERAIVAAPDGVGPLVDGVRIVIAEFHRVLEQHGVRPVKTEGAKFDPSQMEAVMMVPSDEVDEGAVLDVFEKGYRTDDLVIRPARVSVAKKLD